MDHIIRETLSLATKVTVKSSISDDQVPFTIVTVEFKAKEVAEAFFERINPFWNRLVNKWDNQLLSGRAIAFYVIERSMEHVGTTNGRAREVIERIEKYTNVPTNLLTGVHSIPHFSFERENFVNYEMQEILSDIKTLIAERLLDKERTPFTKIGLEFRSELSARLFLERIAPFWQFLYDKMGKERNRFDFYILDSRPDHPHVHGNALKLLSFIEKYSSVTSMVFSSRKVIRNFKISEEEGSC